MGMIEHLARQFRYDAWANRECIRSLRGAVGASPEALRRLAHIVGTERLWLARIRGEPSPIAVWPDFDMDRCASEAALLPGLWTALLTPLDEAGLRRNVAYTNSKGEGWSSTIGDIATHVILHSAYHRGQIASDLRASGNGPANTDFIHAVRQEFVP